MNIVKHSIVNELGQKSCETSTIDTYHFSRKIPFTLKEREYDLSTTNINKSNFSPWWAFNKYVFGTKWRLFVTWIYFRSKQIKLAFLKRRWGRERVSFTCSFSWSDTQTWKNLFLADGLTNYRMATWRHIFNHIYFFHLISNLSETSI